MSDNKFRMPGEFEPHDGCLMIWPERPGSWKDGVEAEKAFATVAGVIGRSETVYMMVSPEKIEHAKQVMKSAIGTGDFEQNIVFIPFSADDSWARDTGPTFVVSEAGRSSICAEGESQGLMEDSICVEKDNKGLEGDGICVEKDNKDLEGDGICTERRGIDWGFNAWGGEYDGLYAHYERDALVAGKLCDFLGNERIDMTDFILEGGSIHVDGEGTLITTEECLLSKGRNPGLTKEEIENKLKEALGVTKIIWLPTGVYNDETNGHVDNFCCFSAPGEVLLAWTDDSNDPNFESCREAFEILSNERDACGRNLKIRKLPFPEEPVVITEKDLEGYVFEEGEDTREVGERLAASYVNFYISNGAVVYPCFGGKSVRVKTPDAGNIAGISEGDPEKTQENVVRLEDDPEKTRENAVGLEDDPEKTRENAVRLENDPEKTQENAGREENLNTKSDIIAGKILAEAFPGRVVMGVDARVILLGGGNIHCITQQIPSVICK